MTRFETRSAAGTEALGRALAACLRRGTLVALYGDLAAGKTCLVRGVAAAFGGAEPAHSPTFVVAHVYRGRETVHHLDLYRLQGVDELIDIGFEELAEPDGITLVEWAERAAALLPTPHVAVQLEHAGGDTRHVVIEDAGGLLAAGWPGTLATAPGVVLLDQRINQA